MIHKIGLEIHVQLKTVTKLFSSSPNELSASPNSCVSSYDVAYPGTLPHLNLQAVQLAIQACYLLKCKISPLLHFDRKHYYYYDLPKGFQITQFHHPLGTKGSLTLLLPNQKTKIIPIYTVHIEEDTAKTVFTLQQGILIDYNRCGIPLIEITTEPVFQNYLEIELFLKKIIRLLKRSEISLAQFSLGSIRVDVNISTSQDGTTFSPRSEIKNLNSFINIKKALQEESNYQIQNFANLTTLYTKTFNEKTKKNQILRKKNTHYEYFFIRENNIAPIHLTTAFLKPLITKVTYLYDWEKRFYQNPHLTYLQKKWIVNNYSLINYFDRLVASNLAPKTVFLFLKEIVVTLNHHSSTETSAYKPNFAFMIALLTAFEQKRINFKIVKEIFFKYHLQSTVDFEKILQNYQNNSGLSTLDKTNIHLFCQNLVKKTPQTQKLFKIKPQRTVNHIFGLLKKAKILSASAIPKAVVVTIHDYFSSL